MSSAFYKKMTRLLTSSFISSSFIAEIATKVEFSNPDISRLQKIDLESTINELPLWDFQLDIKQPGTNVIEHFRTNPNLPGAILTKEDRFIGMISRKRCLEFISRRYGLELYSHRPIEILYDAAKVNFLLLEANTSISEAAQKALSRSSGVIYEPIVVQAERDCYQMLDVHQLLVAQLCIDEKLNHLLRTFYEQLETANQELERLVNADGLTQVANRRRFDQYLTQEWFRSQGEEPLSLVMCDVDFFKLYNDTYGHQAGDDCLRHVAQAIHKSVMRNSDLVARYGGEEFAVILPNTDAMGALAVAERIKVNVEQTCIPHSRSQVSQYVTVSQGVATAIPSDDSSQESLIAAADKALYHAKGLGRNRHYVLDSSED